MPKPSKEYAQFDATMRQILTVPKSVLDERVKAHKAKAARNPKKRGPKPKVKPSVVLPDVPEEADDPS